MDQRPVGAMPAPSSTPRPHPFRTSPTPLRRSRPTHSSKGVGAGGQLLLAAAALLLGGAAAANVSPGDSFYVSGCLVEVIGCYFDPDGKQGCLPQPPKEPAAGCPAETPPLRLGTWRWLYARLHFRRSPRRPYHYGRGESGLQPSDL